MTFALSRLGRTGIEYEEDTGRRYHWEEQDNSQARREASEGY
jgi:hypothetical protein